MQCNKVIETVKEEGIDISEYDFGFYPEACSYLNFSDQDQAKINERFGEKCENKRKCNFKFDPAKDLPD